MDLALFDFDGTITARETMPDFVRAAVPPGRRVPGAILLAPVVLGYRRGWLSGTAVRDAVVRVAFTSAGTDRIRAAGQVFARDALPALVRPEAMARIDAHRRRGDAVVVVSGGLDLYLAPWAASHGLPLVCSTLDERDGRFTGRYRGAQCVGEEKVRRVREAFRVGDFERVHAYGDTAEDSAMLAIADHAHFRTMPTDALTADG